MTRVLILLSLLTFLVACDNTQSTTKTEKDTATATPANTAAQADKAAAADTDCKCGDKENCKCGDKKDCSCGKAEGECGAAKQAKHDCGEGCGCGDKHACACAKGKEGTTVWCDKCGVGFIDGKKVTDKAAVDKALNQS